MAKTVGIARNMTNLGATYFAIGDSLWRLIEYFASVVIFSNVVGCKTRYATRKHDNDAKHDRSTLQQQFASKYNTATRLASESEQPRGNEAGKSRRVRAEDCGATRQARADDCGATRQARADDCEATRQHNLGIIEACRENSETIPFAKSSDNIPESTGSLSIEEGGRGGTSCGKDDGGEEEQRGNSPNILTSLGCYKTHPNKMSSRVPFWPCPVFPGDEESFTTSEIMEVAANPSDFQQIPIKDLFDFSRAQGSFYQTAIRGLDAEIELYELLDLDADGIDDAEFPQADDILDDYSRSPVDTETFTDPCERSVTGRTLSERLFRSLFGPLGYSPRGWDSISYVNPSVVVV
ncbi:hypothetical protein EDB19DRAFT_2024982 [Suillus lakei]|nr:hypothetical protein EDB19DRAFT_2024982 [Suillus lakei]